MWKQYSLLAWGQKVYLYQFDHDTKTNTKWDYFMVGNVFGIFKTTF
jgi:hypothetical protein